MQTHSTAVILLFKCFLFFNQNQMSVTAAFFKVAFFLFMNPAFVFHGIACCVALLCVNIIAQQSTNSTSVRRNGCLIEIHKPG